jgi:hypothetical protein
MPKGTLKRPRAIMRLCLIKWIRLRCHHYLNYARSPKAFRVVVCYFAIFH